jgi:hypothetical protein
MINDIGFRLPDLYLTKPIDSNSLKNIKDENFAVIKRIFMIKSEVNSDYYFMELDVDSGFTVSARIIPNYAIAGNAANQLRNASIKNQNTGSPYFRIKVSLYKINEYKQIWKFEHFTKNESEIYKTIKQIKEHLTHELKKYNS